MGIVLELHAFRGLVAYLFHLQRLGLAFTLYVFIDPCAVFNNAGFAAMQKFLSETDR